jgi:hypothetical protein
MEKKSRKKPTNQTPKLTEEKTQLSKKEQILQIIKKPSKQKFLSESQRQYYDILKNNQITPLQKKQIMECTVNLDLIYCSQKMVYN